MIEKKDCPLFLLLMLKAILSPGLLKVGLFFDSMTYGIFFNTLPNFKQIWQSNNRLRSTEVPICFKKTDLCVEERVTFSTLLAAGG